MAMNNSNVDSYLNDGCGRCDKYQTPECKVHLWTDVLTALREVMRESGLTEEMKWGQPCYTLDGKNVVMMSTFRDYSFLSFFKGILLTDDDGVLELAGPNGRIARVLKFTAVDQVTKQREQIAKFVQQAIELERSGQKLPPGEGPEALPEELEERLDGDPMLRDAFDALTPGRQRSYVIHVSGAKASETRERRIDKCIPKILLGKGFNDR